MGGVDRSRTCCINCSSVILCCVMPFLWINLHQTSWCQDNASKTDRSTVQNETRPATTEITRDIELTPGAINAVVVKSQGKWLAIYAAPHDAIKNVEKVLVNHFRRDLISAAQPAIDGGATLVAPAAEREYIENPTEFWNQFVKTRFHDYACQTTKVPVRANTIGQAVADGDYVDSERGRVRVIHTPGVTRSAVTYVIISPEKRIAFPGDLIVGDGQIFDLYSFQDAIASAEIRGYHGYGSRLAELVQSLRKLQSLKLDCIVPARGPVIDNPTEVIDRLIGRVEKIIANYLSTNALHWYFKEERMRRAGERVLGAGAKIELMPYAHHEKAPDWIFENATSRLVISDSGDAFLLDCGYQRVIDAVQKQIDSGLIKRVTGIFVTHYHDDHTDMVQAAAEHFGCPVYAVDTYTDILENPAAYRMPAVTSNPIKDIKRMHDGQTMQWNEFEFTFHDYPGQTIYHGGLLVRRSGQQPVFFVGDSFAPSGLDDYCVLNRNLLGPKQGYQLCLEKLNRFTEPVWLVNEHIPFVFQFTAQERSYLMRVVISSALMSSSQRSPGMMPITVSMNSGQRSIPMDNLPNRAVAFSWNCVLPTIHQWLAILHCVFACLMG